MGRSTRIIAVSFTLLLLAAPLLAGATTLAFSSGTTYSHPYPQDVKPGDIVIGHTPGLVDWVIPGYWTHTGMIAFYNSSIGDWMVVEATLDGVKLTPLREFLARYDTVAVLRVATTDSVRLAAVNFALEQLGKPYDFFWIYKEVYGSSYYCSELVWASYKAVGGPDIDANPGWSWTYAYGVAPQEIYDDGDTYVIYYSSSS